jgi:hypothetical protein
MGQHITNRGIHGNPPTRMQKLGRIAVKATKFAAIAIPSTILAGYLALAGLNFLSYPGMSAREKLCRPIDEVAQAYDVIEPGKRICGEDHEIKKPDPKKSLVALVEHFNKTQKVSPAVSEKNLRRSQVTLKYFERDDCSATLLTNDGWVSTAAHCIVDIGEMPNYGIEKDGMTYEITDIVLHEKADIALLKANIGGTSQTPIQINYLFDVLETGKRVTVIGIRDGNPYEESGKVLEIALTTKIDQENDEPRDIIDAFTYSAQTTKGVSGGVVMDNNGSYVGVVSGFVSMGENKGHGIAGKITYLKQLIEKRMNVE